jgi:anti-sigma B factor antagonist
LTARRYAKLGLTANWQVTEAQHVLHLKGELDLPSSRKLVEALDELTPGARRVLVDVQRVSFVDSSGLSALLQSRRRCEERGIEFKVTPGTPAVTRLLEITGLTDLPAPEPASGPAKRRKTASRLEHRARRPVE